MEQIRALHRQSEKELKKEKEMKKFFSVCELTVLLLLQSLSIAYIT